MRYEIRPISDPTRFSGALRIQDQFKASFEDTVEIQDHAIIVNHPVLLGGGPDGGLDELNLDADQPDYVTTEGVGVWIERPAKGTRGGQKTRFVDASGEQVGPIHQNFVPAIIWALNEGWRSPGSPDWLNDAAIEEVRAGGCPEGPWPDEPRAKGGVS